MTTSRLVAAIALTACAGCATTGGKVTAIVGAAAAGGAVLAVVGTSQCLDRTRDFLECSPQAAVVGTLGLVAGISLLTSMIIEIYSAPDLPPAQSPAPAPVGTTPGPPFAPPGMTPVAGAPGSTPNR